MGVECGVFYSCHPSSTFRTGCSQRKQGDGGWVKDRVGGMPRVGRSLPHKPETTPVCHLQAPEWGVYLESCIFMASMCHFPNPTRAWIVSWSSVPPSPWSQHQASPSRQDSQVAEALQALADTEGACGGGWGRQRPSSFLSNTWAEAMIVVVYPDHSIFAVPVTSSSASCHQMNFLQSNWGWRSTQPLRSRPLIRVRGLTSGHSACRQDWSL